ncbi:MAG: hypothetical protein KatS3mg035_1421 [Bacteroidia bacterium]|nr:MAG: hypothetical protein KatS3mg035_1421 [Bacteroidia bacterium]
MLKASKNLIYLSLIVFIFFSCRKDIKRPYWDADFSTPILKSELGIKNLLPDSLVQSDADNALNLVYNNTIFRFDMDEMVKIPDTSIINAYGMLLNSYVFNPGQYFLNQTQTNSYYLNGAQISKIIIKSGGVYFKATSEIQEKTEFTYNIPKAIKNGQPFQKIITVPAAPSGGKALYSEYVDLSGYEFDLTGPLGNTYNMFEAQIFARISPSGQPVTVYLGDSLILQSTFADLVPYYAKGYFGQVNFNSGVSENDFSLFNKITNGNINLEKVKMTFRLENGIGADASFKINLLSAQNTRTGSTINLNHSIIGNTININRAIDKLWNTPAAISTFYYNEFNNTNSNFKNMIELLPGKLKYDIDIAINPLGNVSGGNDFIHADHGLNVNLLLEMPLSFSSNKLTLTDTTKVNFSEIKEYDNVQSALLTLIAENGFPFDAELQLTPVLKDGTLLNPLFTNNPIKAADINAAYKVEKTKISNLKIPLDKITLEKLKEVEKMIISIALTTQPQNELLKIYSDYKIKLHLTGDFSYRVNNQQ